MRSEGALKKLKNQWRLHPRHYFALLEVEKQQAGLQQTLGNHPAIDTCQTVHQYSSPVLFPPLETTAAHNKRALYPNGPLQITSPLLGSLLRRSEKNEHLFIAFIDLNAAFDIVDHASLENVLKYLATIFQRHYNNSESSVRVNGKDSDWLAGRAAWPFPIFNHLRTLVWEQVAGE